MAEVFIIVSIPLLFTWNMLTSYIIVIDKSREGATYIGFERKKRKE